MKKTLNIFMILYCLYGNIFADNIKPSLIEVEFRDNIIKLSMSLNLEALMSKINPQDILSTNSTNSDKYDDFRGLDTKELFDKYLFFQKEFLEKISLKFDNKKVDLVLLDHIFDKSAIDNKARDSILIYQIKYNKIPSSIEWDFTDYGLNAIRYKVLDKWSLWVWVNNKDTTKISLINIQKKSFIDRVKRFIFIGYSHVIPLGFDHILFIIGMALSSFIFRDLLILVSVFTFAHSLTLGLSMLDIINISSIIVEPLIALSIAYIAFENIYFRTQIYKKSIIVFIFGLLHGLGFASMLKSFDSNENTFSATLMGFNIGVEIAQICIVLIVFFLSYLINNYTRYFRLFVNIISFIIASVSLYWFMDRINL
jgi:hypothetical protein